uniref:Nucleoside diphosphate kinase-like domain-containing protein n=1 Tax=Terrapene triunguis TaxID=2587831 RepID=A0A674J9R2_9SAUR
RGSIVASQRGAINRSPRGRFLPADSDQCIFFLLDDIMQKVTNAGFIVSQMKETNFTHEMATQFYKAHEGKPFFDQLVNYMSEGPSVIMILTKENAVEEWRQLMGPTDPDVAKKSSPDSLRAQFAQDILCNAVHGSSNKEHALKSIEYVFGEVDLNSLNGYSSICPPVFYAIYKKQ